MLKRFLGGLGFALAVIAASAMLAAAQAATFPLKDDDPSADKLVLYETKAADTLLDVAQAYQVGYLELLAANPGVDPWVPGAGRFIRIPSYYILPNVPRRGIVINLASQRLYYFHETGRVETYAVGIGETGTATPLGVTKVIAKHVDPVWRPTAAIRKRKPELPAQMPPGPDNPLGAFALRLGWSEYLIHGTNNPDSIGRDASSGCLRLYPADIEKLFGLVEKGTRVQVVREDVLGAWVGDRLVIEVYPDRDQAHDLAVTGKFTPTPPKDLVARVKAMAKGRRAIVDWDAVARAGAQRTGLPVWVGRIDATQTAAEPLP